MRPMQMNDVYLSDLYDGEDDSLEHYGVKGMKWGIRRYQNPDGSLTAEGRRHVQGETAGTKSKSVGDKIGSAAGKAAKAVGDRIHKYRVKRAAEKEIAAQKKSNVKQNKANAKKANKNMLDMSDEELSQAVERMKLEDAYRELDRKAHPGREYLKSTAKEFGRKLLTDPGTYVTALRGLDYLVTRKTPEIRLEETKNKNNEAERQHKTDQGALQRQHAQRMADQKAAGEERNREFELYTRSLDYLTPEEKREWALQNMKRKK